MKLRSHPAVPAWPAACALTSILALTALAGCRSSAPPAQPLAPPAVAVSSDVFAGSPLGGPTAPSVARRAAPIDPGLAAPAAGPAPLVVEARWYLAEAQLLLPQRNASASLASRATLVVSSSDERPWQATPRQLAGVRLISGDAALAAAQKLSEAPATSAVLLGEAPAVVREGLTAAVRFERQAAMNGATTGPAASATTVYLTPLGDDPAGRRVQLALAAEEGGQARELVVTDWPDDAPGAPVVLLFPPAAGEAGNIILVLGVRDADPSADAELIAAADDVATAALSSSAAAPMIVPSSASVAFAGALASLGDPDSRRAALAFLARETDASLAEELALAGDDAVLEALAKRLGERWQEVVPVPAAMGFELEREALGALAELDDAGNLPAEMRTLLTLHAGEAGRRAASLEEALRGATTLVELRSILAAENAIYLEDSEAAARVRAFEWLEARGLAPEGYDPLAPREARRAALDAALSAPVQQPQTQPATNGGAR